MIVSAFSGCGKTTLGEKYNNVIDLESSLYKYIFDTNISRAQIEARKATPRKRNPEYPQNYIKAIEDASKKYDIVLTSCGPLIREEMEKRNMEYLLVYPDISCKEEYIQRYINRGNHIDFIKHLEENFEQWVKAFDEDTNLKRIRIKSGENLEEVLIKNNLI